MNNQMKKDENELAVFLDKMRNVQLPVGQSNEDLKRSISVWIDENAAPERRISVWRFISVAATVTLAFIFSILYFMQPSDVTWETSVGETWTKSLPDGSKVTLNATSTVSYDQDWSRKVTLQGEAFFEVTEGQKFTVQTSLGNVQVLGTSFNVFARGKDLEVECKTGKVTVGIPEKTFKETLEPGQRISFRSPGSVAMSSKLPELIGKWKTGIFYFDRSPLTKVFEELQRQYNVNVSYSGPKSRTFSGYFVKDDLDAALEMICLPLGLEYRKTRSATVIISSKADQ